MAGLKDKNFKTVPIKGKGKGNVEVCNFNNKIVIQPKDKISDVERKISDCISSKPKERAIIGAGASTLQAPDNDWMVIQDTNYYKVPESQSGTVTKQEGKALGRINKVKASLVFVHYQGAVRSMLQLSKNAPYNYIDSSAAIPYYQYVLKNKSQYSIQPNGYQLVAWAEGVDKKVKEASAFSGVDGDDSNFTDNTNLDLSADGDNSNFTGNTKLNFPYANNTALDLSFDGNTELDLSIQGVATTKSRNRGRHLGRRKRKRHGIGRGKHRNRGKHLGRVRKSSFADNTNLNLDFDGNTNLNLDFDGGYHRPAMDVVPNNLDLGIDGESDFHGNRGRHLGAVRRRSGVDGNTELDLSFNGGALTEDFHGGGDMLYFDGSEETSNAFGDWVKGVFNKNQRKINKIERREKKVLSKEDADVLANKNKVVYTEDEMKALHTSSGSSKPFKEWTKTEGAKNFFNSMTQFGAAFLQKKSKEAAGETTNIPPTTTTDNKSITEGEKKILGMHPLTFGIASVFVGILAIGTIVYFSKKGKGVPAVAGA